MKFEETVQCCYDCYPSLFAFRWEVLAHLFCAYGDGGNGYRWHNGELVSLGDERDRLYVPRLQEGEQASQPLEHLKEELRKYYTEIFENMNMRQYIEREIEFARDFPDFPREVLSYEERLEQEVEKDIEVRRKINFSLLTDSCAMFNIPDDVKPDWLEGIKETVSLILEHGYGDINEKSEWENEEYVRHINKLYEVARKLGVMS